MLSCVHQGFSRGKGNSSSLLEDRVNVKIHLVVPNVHFNSYFIPRLVEKKSNLKEEKKAQLTSKIVLKFNLFLG